LQFEAEYLHACLIKLFASIQRGNTFCNTLACPFIFKKPKNTQATFGQSATFNCDGVTLAARHITWFKGNHILTVGKKYKILDNNRKLVINNVNEDDIGEYRCKISDLHGDTSATAFLISVNGEYFYLFCC
jgi:hypothetical protein